MTTTATALAEIIADCGCYADDPGCPHRDSLASLADCDCSWVLSRHPADRCPWDLAESRAE